MAIFSATGKITSENVKLTKILSKINQCRKMLILPKIYFSERKGITNDVQSLKLN
jgi:hypothetical protein